MNVFASEGTQQQWNCLYFFFFHIHLELSLENIVMLALSLPYYTPLFIFLYQADSDKLSKRQHSFKKLNKHAEISI